MKKLSILGLSFLVLLLASGVKAATENKADLGPATFGSESKIVEVTAKVVSIDQATRIISLEGPQGNTLTTKVDDDVEGLDKVKKGDLVDIQYYESMAWSLKKAGEKETPTKEVTNSTITAQTGKKPLKIETENVRLVTTVEKIDKKNETVTLKGPEGGTKTIKVKEPKNLEGVKKGDQVVINYTESVAVDVKKK